MSSLRVRQTRDRLWQLFEQHVPKNDIGDKDPERETKILTRCLAAFSIYRVTGCSEAEAGGSVWDGSDDNGIDAAFFDDKEKEVVVVQSKWIQSGSGEPSAADVATFANGVRDLVENQTSNFSKRLEDRVSAISEALSQPGATLRLVLASTGSSSIAVHATNNLARVINELNGEDSGEEGLATFEVIGLSEVFRGLANSDENGKISVEANILEWSYISQPIPAYYGLIDGFQLKAWWNAHGKRLISRNIRFALGKTEVNDQIYHTAEHEPQSFWYFNNGITLVAEKATRAPASAASHASGIFELVGASVVNGAQTVSTIARVSKDESLGQVRVPFRVILLNSAPEGFGQAVTRTNNLQNRVEGRDFVSQDPEQARLREEMAIEGISYEYQRSESFSSSETSCDLIEVTTALACASPDPSHFVAVKTGVGRFYNDLSRAPYKAIFNAQMSGARAFNAVRVLRSVDTWIEEKKTSLDKRSGFRWGTLIHGNRALAALVFKQLGTKYLDVSIRDFPADTAVKVDSILENSYTAVVDYLELHHPNKFLAVLFKSPGKGREVYDAVK